MTIHIKYLVSIYFGFYLLRPKNINTSGLGSQPGFMSSSKFLLPWELPLTKISREELEDKWPNILENAAKRASLRGPDEPVDNRITVKVFVGFEYECPRGHR